MATPCRKKFFLFLFMMISVSSFAEDEQQILDAQFLSEKIQFFYIHHDPSIATQIIKKIADLNCLDEFFYFFVALAKEHPTQIIGWFADAQVKIEEHEKLIHALHWAGLTGEAIQFAQKAHWPAKDMISLGNDIPSFFYLPIAFPGYISCACSHFFATGDAKYIKKVIDTLEVTSKQVNKPEELKELKEEAQGKLTELIFKHERVYGLCVAEAKARKGEAAKVLNQLLDKLHQILKRGAFSEQNGMFNGFILVTDDPTFEERWETLPMMAGPSCNPVVSLHCPKENKLIKVFVLFTGFEIDENLVGNITYDMEVIDSKGKKIKEMRDMPGLKRKIPSRFLIQMADRGIGLDFCPADKDSKKGEGNSASPGIYTINATVKDHVSGKDLKLSTTLELLPVPKS